MEWFEEVDWKKCASEDTILIIETIGIRIFLRLHEKMEKGTYYFGKKNVLRGKREYIIKQWRQFSVKEFQKSLHISEGFVRDSLREARRRNAGVQLKLNL